VLVDEVFRSCKPSWAYIQKVNCQKVSSHITGKNKAFQVKNEGEKKTKTKPTTKQSLVIPEYSSPWYFVLQLFTHPQIVKLMWSKVLLWPL